MIKCQWCLEWFHDSCVGVAVEEHDLTTRFQCPNCEGDPEIFSAEAWNPVSQNKIEAEAKKRATKQDSQHGTDAPGLEMGQGTTAPLGDDKPDKSEKGKGNKIPPSEGTVAPGSERSDGTTAPSGGKPMKRDTCSSERSKEMTVDNIIEDAEPTSILDDFQELTVDI